VIPAELLERRQWVVWRRELRDGKPTKVPYRAGDPATKASSTDPSTWSDYQTAAQVADFGHADGVGYVFAKDDPFVGVDLDAGLSDGDRDTILARLDSYAETSPSGEGVHVIVRAGMNGHPRNRKGPVEVYGSGRYFTVTGRHLPGMPVTIEERQAQLDEILEQYLPATPAAAAGTREVVPVSLDDRDLLDRAFGHRNGGAIEALYRGDLAAHGGDHSSISRSAFTWRFSPAATSTGSTACSARAASCATSGTTAAAIRPTAPSPSRKRSRGAPRCTGRRAPPAGRPRPLQLGRKPRPS